MDDSSIVFPNSTSTSPAFSPLSRNDADGGGETSLTGEGFDPLISGRIGKDEYESRSGSDNLYGTPSRDDLGADDKLPRKKRYHRHTPIQIQQLESCFKQCPHPDEKQRSELSRKLNLDSRQVKFWFQNRRTQLKTHLERHENMILKQENEKLQAENYAIKNAMQHPICNNCGGLALLREAPYEENHLRVENARLKDEFVRICFLVEKLLGKSVSPFLHYMPPPIPNSSFDLAVGSNRFDIVSPLDATLPMGLTFGEETSSLLPSTSIDRSYLLDHALLAMHELISMAEADAPLWVKCGEIEMLNGDEYRRKFNRHCFATKPEGFVTEASKKTGIVNISGSALVEVLLNVDQWAKFFPYLIATSSLIEVISGGMGGTKNSALQIMEAEFQILSPLVPNRKVRFLRFCKQHAEGVWAVVDVSLDPAEESSTVNSFASCRRLPSGCVVRDLPDGGGFKVTWVEHSAYDHSAIHHLYQPLVSSGIGFGALRWVAALQRQCDYTATLLSPGSVLPGISLGRQDQILSLAQRMMCSFCMGVCSSVVHGWELFGSNNLEPDMKVMIRTTNGRPEEPQGVVLSVATSVWMPVPPQRLFDFLRDKGQRGEWDNLSTGGPMQEMLRLPRGHEHDNCAVSILRASSAGQNQSNTMLILQETWTDSLCSLVVYSPVDWRGIQALMNGRGPDCVALLPSGFVILPDGCDNHVSGSLLTVGFQIFVSSPSMSNMTGESVQTVSDLIRATLQKIERASSLGV